MVVVASSSVLLTVAPRLPGSRLASTRIFVMACPKCPMLVAADFHCRAEMLTFWLTRDRPALASSRKVTTMGIIASFATCCSPSDGSLPPPGLGLGLIAEAQFAAVLPDVPHLSVQQIRPP